MLALEIVLIVIGIFFFALSFFVTEKLSSSDVEYIKNLSEKEIKVLLEKELEDAKSTIDSKIDEKTEDAISKIESETDKDTDNKLLSIGEYSDTVIKNFNENSEKTLQSVNESHDQITFIYSMLSDKEKKIEELSEKLYAEEANLRNMKTAIDEAMEALSEKNIAVKKAEEAENKRIIEEQQKEDVESLKEAFEKKLTEEKESIASLASAPDAVEENSEIPEASEKADETSEKNIRPTSALEQYSSANIIAKDTEKSLNDKVLELYKQGYSEVDIAKNLGKGIGEVKLILGLFDEGKK